MKYLLIIGAAILILATLIFIGSFPSAPTATSTPPIATSTPPSLPHCSQATLDEVAKEKADSAKGIHTYAVVEQDCQELH